MRTVSLVVAISLFITYLPVPVSAQANRVVSIVSPGPGEMINGRYAEVSAAYNTGTSDRVTHLELMVDGKSHGVKYLSDPQTRGVASFLVDTTDIGNGGHNFVIKIYSGKKLIGSTSGNYKVGNKPIDVLAPDLRFTGIKNGAVVSGVARIEIAAKDNGRDNPLVSVFVDKSLKLIKNVPPYVYELDTVQYGNGKHILEACAYDSSGNRSEAEKIEFLVQNGGKAAIASSAAHEGTLTAKAPESAKPIIPTIARTAASAAGRSADRIGTVSGKVNAPVAKPDLPVAMMSAPTTTHVETQRAEATMTPPATARVEAGNSIVVAAVPEGKSASAPSVRMPAVSSSDVPKTQVYTAPAADPVGTKPGMSRSGNTSSEIVASVPSGVEAPASTMSPSSTEPPVTTAANERPDAGQSALESVGTESEFGQKLVKPRTEEQPKPVKLALAPKPVIYAVQPSLEARKVKLTLETKKINGVTVSELRYVIESAGGTIVAWDNRLKLIVATIGKNKFKIRINEKVVIINGKSMKMSSAPYVNSKGRTVVDIKFLKSLIGTRLERNVKNGKWVLVSK